MVPQYRSILALGLPILLAATPAKATASLTCNAADRNVSFDLLANMSSSDGGSIQLIGGTIRLKAVRGKFEATEFKIESAHIAGQWNFGKELRLGIASDEVRDISVYLAIIAELTKGGDDMDHYRGGYVLKVRGPKGETELKGKIKGCDAG